MPKRKTRVFKRQWIFIGLIIILFVLMLGLNARLAEYFRLNDQKIELEDRIAGLEATHQALSTQIAYAESDKAVEEWARTFERQGQPGDILIIPHSPEEGTKEVNYIPTPAPEDQQKWQIWWQLFFD